MCVMDDITNRIAALEAELADLKAHVTAPATQESSRRDMFKKLALAGAGVAVGGVLTQAAPAAAADNDNIVIGKEDNTAASPTALIRGTFTGRHTLLIDDASGFGDSDSSHPGALAGWSDTRTGIYGYTGNGPEGIVAIGDSPNGAGLLAIGGRANIQLRAEGEPGPARIVQHAAGELVADKNADLWLCVVAGTPGIWRKVGGPQTSGQLHLLAKPVRVYDSRPGEAPTNVTPKTPLAPSVPRTIDARGNNSGVPTTATG